MTATAVPFDGGHRRAMVLMSAAMLVIPAVDGLAKHLSTAGGLSPGVVTFGRFFFQTLFSGVLLGLVAGWRRHAVARPWLNLLRGMLIGASSLMFFIAVKYMPVADAIAVFFVEPFILTILSVVFLRERVGWRRVAALVMGFAGAILVIQPSWALFGPVALLPLGAATTFAIYMLLNAFGGARDSPLVMQTMAGVGGMAATGLAIAAGTGIADFAPTLPADLGTMGLVAAAGVIGAVCHLGIVEAFRHAPATQLAPLQYLEIVSAVAIGVMWFGDFPTPSKWFGIAIIIGSGLFLLRRQEEARRP